MSAESECKTNGWTVNTLHEHVVKLMQAKEERDVERFSAQREATAIAMAAADRAVSKAETAAEKRFESVNEFRSTLADQQRMLMPRNESDLQFDSIRNELNVLKEALAHRNSRGDGLHQGWLILLGLASLAGVILGLISFFKP